MLIALINLSHSAGNLAKFPQKNLQLQEIIYDKI